MKWRYGLLLVLAAWYGSDEGAGNAWAVECENPPVLRFSLVPQGNADRDLAAYRPLAEAVRARSGKPVQMLQPTSYGSVVEGLVGGGVDFGILGPAAYLKARRSNPAVTVFASYAKRGGPFLEEGAFYRALLVVRGDGPYRNLTDLRGRALALTDPGSTSGAVLPRQAWPALTGSSLDQYFGQLLYVGDHDRAGLAVAAGRVDGAFLSSFHLNELVRSGRLAADSVRVLWRSEPIPQDAIVYRGNLCPQVLEAIRSAFLDRGGAAYPALLEAQGTLRFVPMGDEDYRILRDLP